MGARCWKRSNRGARDFKGTALMSPRWASGATDEAEMVCKGRYGVLQRCWARYTTWFRSPTPLRPPSTTPRSILVSHRQISSISNPVVDSDAVDSNTIEDRTCITWNRLFQSPDDAVDDFTRPTALANMMIDFLLSMSVSNERLRVSVHKIRNPVSTSFLLDQNDSKHDDTSDTECRDLLCSRGESRSCACYASEGCSSA